MEDNQLLDARARNARMADLEQYAAQLHTREHVLQEQEREFAERKSVLHKSLSDAESRVAKDRRLLVLASIVMFILLHMLLSMVSAGLPPRVHTVSFESADLLWRVFKFDIQWYLKGEIYTLIPLALCLLCASYLRLRWSSTLMAVCILFLGAPSLVNHHVCGIQDDRVMAARADTRKILGTACPFSEMSVSLMNFAPPALPASQGGHIDSMGGHTSNSDVLLPSDVTNAALAGDFHMVPPSQKAVAELDHTVSTVPPAERSSISDPDPATTTSESRQLDQLSSKPAQTSLNPAWVDVNSWVESVKLYLPI
jgi:hypothetical protein